MQLAIEVDQCIVVAEVRLSEHARHSSEALVASAYGGRVTDQREFLASLPRKRMAVGVIFRDSEHRVLLVEPTYRDRWQLPGGVVEADESPATAATREVAEELGLDLPIGRPLVIRWLGPTDDDPHGVVVFDYDGGHLPTEAVARIQVPPDELRGSRFVDVDEVETWTTAGTAARVRAAVRALDEGGIVQLEGNEPRI